MSGRFPRSLRIRVAVVFLGAVVLLAVTWLRVAYLQIVQGERYLELALEQRYRAENLVPERGNVYDRHGVPLAATVAGNAVYAVPYAVGDAQRAAAALAPILGQPAQDLVRRLTQDAPSVWLAIRTEPEVARAVDNLALPGVYVVERPMRDYPHGQLAADVLGFTGLDNQGLAGLEFQYEAVLRGVPGRHFSERDPRGRAIPGGISRREEPVPGNDLVLTLDRVIQYIAETELARGVHDAQAQWGTAVVMRPATGEILAMAVHPSFDPARYAEHLPRAFRNPAIADQYEPGSVMKLFTAAAALEEGLANLDTIFAAPAALSIGGGIIHCHNPAGYGELSLKDAIAQSCNTVLAQLGAGVVGGPTLARYLRAFGFGSRLGVDLPGEATGSVPEPGQVAGEKLRWANVSFGQGVAVTPLQLASAVAALANGGTLMRPYIVAEVRGPDGDTLERRAPTPIRQVISPETARDVAEAMVAAVEQGTGAQAQIPGYLIGGKTGTAQVPEGGTYGSRRLASFAGFAPAGRPELVVVVMLHDVQQDPPEGGRWAAPVFARIMSRALQHLGIPPGGGQAP
ncbi:MAG: penicillin-binding protein 2 [Firmicutes bacterium]|nr:penicillin-binding protein 2 [Bacillota bacterium]